MSKNRHHEDGPSAPEAGKDTVTAKNVTIKDYIGQKAKVRVEGATTADVTLIGFDDSFIAVTDADGRTKFHGKQFVREVFPNQ